MRKKLLILPLLFLQINFVHAHVGNSNVALESMVGPYHVMVNIKPPNVIPGTATITLFLEYTTGIKIYARPIYFYSGRDGAPPPDIIPAVPGKPGQFEGILWLMDVGSSSVELSIDGPLGKGELVIPVMAVSTAEKKIPKSIFYILLALGIFLFILLVTIIGLSVSDGITKRGEVIPVKRRHQQRIACVVAAILASLLIYCGNAWWQHAAKNYRKFLFEPMHATYHVEQKNGVNKLQLTIDAAHSQRGQWLSYIIPDHGKIMHLFIIGLPAMNIFVHLHPVRLDSVNFITCLPALPRGKYLAYADIVYSSGFTETLKDSFVITEPIVNTDLTSNTVCDWDNDNSFAIDIAADLENNSFRKTVTSAKYGSLNAGVRMEDGSLIFMEGLKNNESYESDRLYSLHFSIWDKNGAPAEPDLYMGMKGHAVILRNDGAVFSHIHPVGTYSMAAQTSLLNRMDLPASEYHYPNRALFRDSIDRLIKTVKNLSEKDKNEYLMKEMKMPGTMTMNESRNGNASVFCGDTKMINMREDNRVSFPYTFPSPGKYRIWVQFKRNGQVLTAAFDTKVE